MSSPLQSTIAIRTRGGFEIVVPSSLAVMSTYVFLEQEDWFEDELPFVRRAVGAPARVIDIGANFGAYALSLARAVGPQGRVFAFEPSASTAAHLRASATRNGFAQLEVIERAMSDRVGRAVLGGTHAELRALAADSAPGESVEVTTLDAWQDATTPGAIEFMKIDAEGHERAIIEGGARFFRDQDPLVMLEVRTSAAIDLSAASALSAFGYQIFGLVPGLGVLVPIERLSMDGKGRLDPALLNVFLCKATRRDALAARGLLVASWTPIETPSSESWMTMWSELPAYRAIAASVAHAAPRADSADVHRALGHYFAAQEVSHDMRTRLRHLDAARLAIGAATARTPTAARLSTLARIFVDFGWREFAQQALMMLKDQLQAGQVVLDEPFLAPLARADTLPAPNAAGWLATALAEAYLTRFQRSTYFAGGEAAGWLDFLKSSGGLTPPLARQRQLTRLRRGQQTAVEPDPLLTAAAPDHLNPALWSPEGARVWSRVR